MVGKAAMLKSPRSSFIAYDKVERDWIGNRVAVCEKVSQVGQGSDKGEPGAELSSMLRRWEEEIMCDQPYNTIGAVRKMNDGTVADKTVTSLNHNSSVQYLEPDRSHGSAER
jgi:hypothetical protein